VHQINFKLKQEDFSSKRKGKREYLSKPPAREFTTRLNSFLESKVEVPRVKRGKRQEIESLLNEEALLLAKYLRDERSEWTPRVPII
jgi:hypothetical protein